MGELSESLAEHHAAAPRRRWIWPVVKWSLFAVLLYFVGKRGLLLWRESNATLSEVDWQPGWIVLGAGIYFCGWLPSAWFWWKLLKRVGQHVRFPDALRAYYCGHLGKYIPGKATVLVIRGGLLRGRGARPGLAGLAAAYETLIFMGSGAAIGAALVPLMFRHLPRSSWPVWLVWSIDFPLLPPLIVAIVCLVSLPVIARVFTFAANKMTPAELRESSPPLRIESRTIAEGLLAFAVSWGLQGLCLGCMLSGVGISPFDLSLWPVWTGSISSATVAGFAAIFAPGGVGVREWILGETLRLQPSIGAVHALSAAVLLRLVTFVVEIAAAGILYVAVRPAALGPLRREE